MGALGSVRPATSSPNLTRFNPMKTCPFCKEKVHVDAIKCKFCRSMLVEIQLTPKATEKPTDDSRITYILDRDLVRFAKFSGAVLAVFLVVGAYLNSTRFIGGTG